MHILIANNTRIPVRRYGGTERVIWWLGQELVRRGHKVTYLVARGSSCPFAGVLPYDAGRPVAAQVPDDVDFAHIHFPIEVPPARPYMVTIHGNGKPGEVFDVNTVFVSRNHASRHGSRHFVYNGLGLGDYGKVDLHSERSHFLFLSKGSRKEKNKRGAIRIARALGGKLVIIGARGISLNGSVLYRGFLGGAEKNVLLSRSRGLLFPVRWNEPFGLSIIESLYFGAPVFGTTYGSLPELVVKGAGALSNSFETLAGEAGRAGEYDRRFCHEYVADGFNSSVMTDNYLRYYELVLNGGTINTERPAAPADAGVGLLPFV